MCYKDKKLQRDDKAAEFKTPYDDGCNHIFYMGEAVNLPTEVLLITSTYDRYFQTYPISNMFPNLAVSTLLSHVP